VIVIGSRFGRFEPKRAIRSRGWRRIGTLVVRWPGPVLVATIALALVGLLALPSYKTSYDARKYLPEDIPANVGYEVADRHFNSARMNPELLMIQSDHDLRTSADFLVIDKIAKAIFHTPGISRVQTITRPDGKPIKHSTIPFQISMQGTSSKMNEKYQQDSYANMLKQANDMQTMIDTLTHMLALMDELSANIHDMTIKITDLTNTVYELRDHIADFDDWFRPLRAYLYWEPHCDDIPLCTAGRGIFDTLDGIDELSDQIGGLVTDTQKLDALTPQLAASLRPQLEQLKSVKQMLLTTYQTQKGMQDQMAAMQDNATAMGDAFDASRNDDTFYLPPEIFNNKDFKRGMKNFISPDGHSVRFIISHEGDPATVEGISHIDAIKQAAKEAIKGTPLEGSTIYLAGTAATYKDMRDGSFYDLLIAGISAVTLIFIIMLIITRSVVAAAVIVGTVLLSLGASFGLSVLLWQHLLGLELHWMVLAMSVILLLAVGSDYNLLLVSRFKEELGGGLKTGIIRSMAGTGSVVTSAGLVFAATMATFAFSDLKVMGQVGTTIALGLLFDTLVVRSFMTPAIAALMGKWFWWPQIVRSRAAMRVPPPPGPAGEPVTTRV
jgi:RND superfamily putative drug exporter